MSTSASLPRLIRLFADRRIGFWKLNRGRPCWFSFSGQHAGIWRVSNKAVCFPIVLTRVFVTLCCSRTVPHVFHLRPQIKTENRMSDSNYCRKWRDRTLRGIALELVFSNRKGGIRTVPVLLKWYAEWFCALTLPEKVPHETSVYIGKSHPLVDLSWETKTKLKRLGTLTIFQRAWRRHLRKV